MEEELRRRQQEAARAYSPNGAGGCGGSNGHTWREDGMSCLLPPNQNELGRPPCTQSQQSQLLGEGGHEERSPSQTAASA